MISRYLHCRTFILVLCAAIGSAKAARGESAFAGKICVNKTSKVLTVRSRCKSSETLLKDQGSLTGPQGASGAAGAAGTDGSIRIYGDGSAGPLNVTSGFNNFVSDNPQFTTCNVSAGATLNVPSGTTIRCTEGVTIAGTISVGQSAIGGVYNSTTSTNVYTASLLPPHPGISKQVASSGELGAAGATLKGGRHGYSAVGGSAESFLWHAPWGGGGGGASQGAGGAGGGSLRILAKGTVDITGIISAGAVLGSQGGGGGAGGVIFVASQTGVTLQSPGLIAASGADGGASTSGAAAGGGGAGGYIRIISPNNSVDAARITLPGGQAGSSTTQISDTVAIAGGAGGSCLEGGGTGGDVGLGRPASSSGATSGSAGISVVTTADPTSLF